MDYRFAFCSVTEPSALGPAGLHRRMPDPLPTPRQRRRAKAPAQGLSWGEARGIERTRANLGELRNHADARCHECDEDGEHNSTPRRRQSGKSGGNHCEAPSEMR